MSKKRSAKRQKTSRSEKIRIGKVSKRYYDMRMKFRSMSMPELESIKEQKRSVTDQHAFKEAYEEKIAAGESIVAANLDQTISS